MLLVDLHNSSVKKSYSVWKTSNRVFNIKKLRKRYNQFNENALGNLCPDLDATSGVMGLRYLPGAWENLHPRITCR